VYQINLLLSGIFPIILHSKQLKFVHIFAIIKYHLFSSSRRSVQDYKIHMYMEIVTFLGIKK